MTTRQIADAAGVAEGTIFGVFPDKASLIRAAIIDVFRPEPVVQVVNSLHFVESLRDRMETIAELLMAGVATRRPLIAAIRSFAGDRVDPEFVAQMDSRTQRDRRRHHPGDRARPGPAATQPGRGRPDNCCSASSPTAGPFTPRPTR